MDQLVTVLLGRAKHEGKAVPAVVSDRRVAVPAVGLEMLADLCFLCSLVCSAPRSCRVVRGKRDRRAAGHSENQAALTTLLPIKLPDCRLALLHSL